MLKREKSRMSSRWLSANQKRWTPRVFRRRLTPAPAAPHTQCSQACRAPWRRSREGRGMTSSTPLACMAWT